MRRSTEQSFWARKTIKKNGCWEWTGSVTTTGYGQLFFRGTLHKAHRLAYLLTHGSIPDGKLIAHKCDNTKCFNPEHIYAGTRKDNIWDSIAHGKLKNKHAALLEREKVSVNKRKSKTERAILIRTLSALGTSYSNISRSFRIDKAAISRIVNRKTYKST
ncbi:MAG: HNH endonuclease signature motif containing protein [Patescibacteria group bacterium]